LFREATYPDAVFIDFFEQSAENKRIEEVLSVGSQ